MYTRQRTAGKPYFLAVRVLECVFAFTITIAPKNPKQTQTGARARHIIRLPWLGGWLSVRRSARTTTDLWKSVKVVFGIEVVSAAAAAAASAQAAATALRPYVDRCRCCNMRNAPVHYTVGAFNYER